MSEPKHGQKISFSTIIWFAVAAIAVWFIATHLITTGRIVIVILGFSLMVFIHELGHFTMAKLTGIKVEIFSMGFPPPAIAIKRTEKGYRVRLLPFLINREREESGEGGLIFTFGGKKKPGETEYQIGLIPFGGFVKMLGQEDFGEAKKNDDPRSYMNKPPHTRLAVIAGGVIFNVISAVIFFMAAFMVGLDFMPPVVGAVAPDYPAAKTSLKAGDEIIEIDGVTKDLDFGDIILSALASKQGEEIPMKVKHQDGTTEKIYLTAEKKPGDPQPLFGIAPPLSLQIAKLEPDDANYLMAKTGLMPDDKIISINNQDIEYFWQMEEILQSHPASVSLLVERKTSSNQTALIETTIPMSMAIGHICSMVPRLKVESVESPQASLIQQVFNNLRKLLARAGIVKESAKYTLGLKEGDVIIGIADVNYPTYAELREITESYQDKELSMKVLRSQEDGLGKIAEITVIPVNKKGRIIIGFLPGLDVENPVIAKTIQTNTNLGKLDIPDGATISKINGAKVSSFFEIVQQLLKNNDTEYTIEFISPEGKKGSISFKAQKIDELINASAVFGCNIPFAQLERTYKADGPVNAISMGFRKTFRFLKMTYASIRAMIQGRVSAAKSAAGPIGILHMSYTIVSQEPLVYYVYFIGLISTAIAVFNFLPFPPLDGGLAVFLLIEKIKGSPVNTKIQASIAGFGWILIGALAIYVTFNDIARIITGLF
ncbi:MAG: site-2 protease family protein [Sedimentisphaerales bacterium]|nr:site-2 protease family protein [Sedimentisphaerales bacterium]